MREIVSLLVFYLLNLKLGDTTEKLCTLKPCDEDKLMAFLAKIQVLNPESIVNLAVDDLENLCRKLDEVIKNIDHNTKNCSLPPPDNLYVSLISGVRVLNEKCCTAGSPFYKRLEAYFSCLHDLIKDFGGCGGPADWTEEPEAPKRCKFFKNILDCYYIKSAKVCGVKAAKTMKELSKDIIHGVICITCGVGSNPYVLDPMPDRYMDRNKGEIIHYNVKLILLFCITSFTLL